MSHNPTPHSPLPTPGSEATVTGIVLGAGKSSRFGSPKQLLPFGDTTLLGQVARNANASKLDEVIVVLGRASEELRGSVDFGRARVVENTAYGAGCASSLLAGMDTAGEGCEAIMLLLGDQPGVRTEFVDRAIAEWRRERPWAAVASYRGIHENRASSLTDRTSMPEPPREPFPDSRLPTPHSPERPKGATNLGHPFIFDREAFGNLRELHGDKAVWKLIEAYPERISRIEMDAELPPDVDTPEDYEVALAHWRRGA